MRIVGSDLTPVYALCKRVDILDRPMPSESYRLDAAPPPRNWLNATLIRWGFTEAPVNALRRVVVIWSHGFAETAVWLGESELGRFADAALLRRGVTFSLDDKTNL